jgi:hypothetical protein
MTDHHHLEKPGQGSAANGKSPLTQNIEMCPTISVNPGRDAAASSSEPFRQAASCYEDDDDDDDGLEGKISVPTGRATKPPQEIVISIAIPMVLCSNNSTGISIHGTTTSYRIGS